MPMPLEGIRVLDWTIWQQGPVSTMMLGDLGAEVIKIEERVGGDPGRGVMSIGGTMTGVSGQRNYYFEVNNRHKKSITLNLKTPEAKEIVYKLMERGIQSRPLFEPMHLSKAFADVDTGIQRSYARAEIFHKSGLSLPCSVGLKDSEIELVVREISSLSK